MVQVAQTPLDCKALILQQEGHKWKMVPKSVLSHCKARVLPLTFQWKKKKNGAVTLRLLQPHAMPPACPGLHGASLALQEHSSQRIPTFPALLLFSNCAFKGKELAASISLTNGINVFKRL